VWHVVSMPVKASALDRFQWIPEREANIMMIGADHSELRGDTFAAIVLNCECSEQELCAMSATNCFQHKKTCMLKFEQVSL